MTEPTPPAVPAPDDAPDPVLDAEPQAVPVRDDGVEEVDELLDAPRPADGFPPAPAGVPGAAMPVQRPL